MLPVASLVPYAKNAKKHTQAQIKGIVASIREVGFRFPVAVDENNEIIAGHGRVLAAQKLGMTQVPCIRHEDLTPTQKRALRIADNKLAEIAGTDRSLLTKELDELMSAGVDAESIGFTKDEIDKLLAPEQCEVREVDVSEVSDEFWISVRGPLPKQPDALTTLRKALECIDGVDVQLGTSEGCAV